MASLTLADMARRMVPGNKAVAKKHWIKGAIKHPGRETRRAKEHGVSTHEQMESDSHSKNKSLAAAGRLGLALSAKSKKSRGERWYGKD
jgi:hypothetical protein